MPEILRRKEVLPLAETIACGMHYWLFEEIESSRDGRNAVLDNFYEARKSFMLRASDASNKNIGKNEGHYNRLKLWTPQFIENSKDDYLTARQLFCTQMYLSGMFRLECFVVANDQAEYEFRRFGGQVLGIDIESTVNNRLLGNTSAGLEKIAEDTHKANEQTHSVLGNLHDQNRKPGTIFNYARFLNSRRAWLDSLISLQEMWLNLSTDYILYATEARGGELAKVPFLEPKSISDNPQIYYPFSL